jgi:hypothetical protein
VTSGMGSRFETEGAKLALVTLTTHNWS